MEEENAEEVEVENDPEDLADMLSNLKLRGFPTPTGKKTVFVCADTVSPKINWGEFSSV